MLPVSVIESKVRPYFERSSFVHYRYDESEVVNGGYIVCVQYTFASSLVIAPHGDKFGGKMVVRVVFQFANKG